MAKRVVTNCKRDDKARYATMAAAWSAIDRLKERGATDAEELTPYRCTAHHAYHIGRR